MTRRATNVAILGSTGSIGRSTAEVISNSGGLLRAVAISAHSSLDLLLEQARALLPRWVLATDSAAAASFDWSDLPADCELVVGPEGPQRVVAENEVDTVVAAIVGGAAVKSTIAALSAGKVVALANKETLVMAGPLVMDLTRSAGATLLPVDSEHSAVFQALSCGRTEEVARVVLTASGGPFRNHSLAELATVTVEQALAHPTWDMGPKITVDSATMMNKALEIIEARWLFGLAPEQIAVVIHPQSIVHSFVEYIDGSVVAQLSPPDMKLPIQYALYYPDRRPGIAAKIDWSQPFTLEFEPPDFERFGALELGMEVARAGGSAGCVLNAANEAAAGEFLGGRLGFAAIIPACRAVVEQHHFEPDPGMERLLKLDAWAREEIIRWVPT